jgi:hypothetical protein
LRVLRYDNLENNARNEGMLWEAGSWMREAGGWRLDARGWKYEDYVSFLEIASNQDSTPNY